MNKPQRILIVEIRTLDNPDLDSSQLSTLIAHREQGKLYLDSIDAIRSAIVDGIIHLGSNYRHPLLFRVQVISESKKPRTKRRRRRHRSSNGLD